MIKNKSTLTLIAILSIALVVLIVLGIAVINNVIIPAFAPKTEWVELPIKENMTLSQAKEMLESLGVSYEVKPTDSRIANRVEKFEYIGKEENGKHLAEVGKNVILYANEKSVNEVVYLTFDDGPIVNYNDSAMTDIYHTTADILDTLDDYGIKASFFIVGYQMVKSDRSKYVNEIFNRGHLLACHTYSHEFSKIYSSIDSFLSDVAKFENQLKDILGEEKFNSIGKYIRFPGGSSTNNHLTKSEALEYISAVREKGYKVYDWTTLTGDAEGKSTTSEFITYLFSEIDKAKDKGQPLIVLMHDKYTTSQSLPAIIDRLISEGYYFDTVDNCPEYTFAER